MTFLPVVVSFLLSLLTIPLVRWLSFRFGYVKQPRQDRWSRKPTPTLGGAAVFLAFLGSIMLFVRQSGSLSLDTLSLLLGAGLAFLVGLVDDLHPLKPPVKLAGQLGAATIVIFFGSHVIDFFPWPIANILLTYIWLVGITNSINLLDNIDGLAGGVALIAAGLLCIFLWKFQNLFLFQVTLALAGALLGFLVFNFPPAKIYMGDSGSLFIGFLLASLAVFRRSQASNVLSVLAVPILIFLLPILDTTLVTITRLLRGQSPAQGGTDHTSHRLVTFGLSERQAIFVLYGVALIGGVSGVALEALDYDTSLVLIPLVLIILSLITAYLGRLKIVMVPEPVPNNFSRWMSDLTYRRRLFELLLDLVLVGFSYYLAFWTRFGLDMTQTSMGLFLRSWPIALASAYVVFYFVGVYKGVWRFIGLENFFRFFGAAIGTAFFSWIFTNVLFSEQGYSLDIFVLFALFLLLGLAGTRSTFVILDRLADFQRVNPAVDKVLLVGAGAEGELALRWILRNPNIGYRPIGFLDPDQSLWGRVISGIEIYGSYAVVEEFLQSKKKVDGIILTAPVLLEQPEIIDMMNYCRQKGLWIRVLRFEFELVEPDLE
jgi:UDP-GlcNAc:undecaprenyl-phosphate GlcNAc-1-phosphate transferase